MRALQANALDTKKRELRDFYAVDDIQRQLNGLPSTVPTVVPEPTYTHPERTRIVEKLFSSKLCKVGTDADIQNRVSALTDLVAPCKLKDLPVSRRYRWTKPRNWSLAMTALRPVMTVIPGYLSRRPQWRPLAFQVPQDLALSTTCLDGHRQRTLLSCFNSLPRLGLPTSSASSFPLSLPLVGLITRYRALQTCL